jgi:putative transcriptional regulator
MIVIRLREMMDAHEARTGQRVTYASLAAATGLSRPTLESIASRPGYNASLVTIERICLALHCSPGDLLVLADDRKDRSG